MGADELCINIYRMQTASAKTLRGSPPILHIKISLLVPGNTVKPMKTVL